MSATAELDRIVAERLLRRGLRYTATRRSLVHRLQATGPVTLPELLDGTPELPQSSAYRNLSQLEEVGIVRRLLHDQDHARYELAEALTEHHHHLICDDCGQVRDITLDAKAERALDASSDAVATAEGFTVRQHVIDLYGTCTDCARRQHA